jgi:hypothetical protein
MPITIDKEVAKAGEQAIQTLRKSNVRGVVAVYDPETAQVKVLTNDLPATPEDMVARAIYEQLTSQNN